MKRLFCDCGSEVFFDSERCLHCGADLGFDPETLELRALSPLEGEFCQSAEGRDYRRCANGVQFDVCNWLLPADAEQALCFACQFNRTVPNQSLPGNQLRWKRLEEGKKRLFYTLMCLELPLVNGWRDTRYGLLFDFIEDSRSRDGFEESFVSTGYLGGVITINTLEADNLARLRVREELNESYRTVLGHLRHESGHYYWARLDPDPALRAGFNQVFGDESQDYASALARYYERGPRVDWREHFISAYASAHPSEDWAESWGHYLHIHDALETAHAHGLLDEAVDDMPLPRRISQWRQLSLTLNELNRSVGLGDAYPFVINAVVERKLGFVDTVIQALQKLR